MNILVSYIILAVISLAGDGNDLEKKEIGYDIGQYPPQFEFRKILDERSVESLSWEKLRGNVVIVDFWATWCLPCIETIPHINGLVEKFKGEPVIFISTSFVRSSMSSICIIRSQFRNSVNCW